MSMLKALTPKKWRKKASNPDPSDSIRNTSPTTEPPQPGRSQKPTAVQVPETDTVQPDSVRDASPTTKPPQPGRSHEFGGLDITFGNPFEFKPEAVMKALGSEPEPRTKNIAPVRSPGIARSATSVSSPGLKNNVPSSASSHTKTNLSIFLNHFGVDPDSLLSDAKKPIKLTGADLTPEQVVAVARHDARVEFDEGLMKRVSDGNDVLIEAARQGIQVYGLSSGVGGNKDVRVLGGEAPDGSDQEQAFEKMLERSRAFNRSSIRAHTSGVGEPMSRELVRAGMLIRLNQMLKGSTGASPAIVRILQLFLNNDITPRIPGTGSIGEGDIVLMAHVGMVMVGEGEVIRQARNNMPAESSSRQNFPAVYDVASQSLPQYIVPARQALAEAGIDPVTLIAKDFLSTISHNALTAGSMALAVHDAGEFLMRETAVFALCLQALNGNLAPFLAETNAKAQPYLGKTEMAAAIEEAVRGSSLEDGRETTLGRDRNLQDPISFRSMPSYLGEVKERIASLTTRLLIQMNSSEDNPYVALDYQPGETTSKYEQKYVVEMPDGRSAAIFPTGNFEAYPAAASADYLLLSLRHLGAAMTQNCLRFETPAITKLPAFLAGSEFGHGFGAVSKGVGAVFNEVRAAATPLEPPYMPVAGGQMEDMSNAAPVTANKLHAAIRSLYSSASYQLLYAAQAIELRKELHLSPVVNALYEEYRASVPYVDQDHRTDGALALGMQVLQNWPRSSLTKPRSSGA